MRDVWGALLSKVSPYVEADDDASPLSKLMRLVERKIHGWEKNVLHVNSVTKTKSVYKY